MTHEQLKAAEEKIKRAVPDTVFAWTDYDFSLSVAAPARKIERIVYQAKREHQAEIVGNIAQIISDLS